VYAKHIAVELLNDESASIRVEEMRGERERCDATWHAAPSTITAVLLIGEITQSRRNVAIRVYML
jgi:hypothetical protein